MRLRYVALPEYGPLRDLRIAFGRETLLPGRIGTLNFIVGVNGTGKSHLFRALFEIFRHLEIGKLPMFATTVIYDHEGGNSRTAERRTVFFDYNPSSPEKSFFLHVPALNADWTVAEWEQRLSVLRSGTMAQGEMRLPHPALAEGLVSAGTSTLPSLSAADIRSGIGSLAAYLPNSVIAYTSGSLVEWHKLTTPWMAGDDLPEHREAPDLYDERPADWNTRNELVSADAEWRDEPMSSDERQKFRTGLLRREPSGEICRLIGSNEMHLAAAALGVWQAAHDFRLNATETQRDAFRLAEREALSKKDRGEGPRRMFRSVDWLWATHLSLVLDPAQRIPQLATDELWFCLHALADRVMQLPNGMCQFVIRLAPNERADFNNVFPTYFKEMADLPSGLGAYLKNTAGSVSGAETLVRLFSGTNLESGLLPFFSALREWRRESFLERATVTVRRISGDDILSLESFSDGEQMLLGRSSLLFLLRNQSDSLLLLDEPETHFNDAWKREIVSWIDEQILKTTPAQVLVSTHTSIALSDVFSSEVAVVDRENGQIRVLSVKGPLFGTDPSEVMMNVFGTPESIGPRSQDFLEALLERHWKTGEVEELETLLKHLGSGFHRAELRARLDELKGKVKNAALD